jgi:hypothetical protein
MCVMAGQYGQTSQQGERNLARGGGGGRSSGGSRSSSSYSGSRSYSSYGGSYSSYSPSSYSSYGGYGYSSYYYRPSVVIIGGYGYSYGYSYYGYGFYGYYGYATRANYAYNYYPPLSSGPQICKENDLNCLIDFDSQNDSPFTVENTYSLAYASDSYIPIT